MLLGECLLLLPLRITRPRGLFYLGKKIHESVLCIHLDLLVCKFIYHVVRTTLCELHPSILPGLEGWFILCMLCTVLMMNNMNLMAVYY